MPSTTIEVSSVCRGLRAPVVTLRGYVAELPARATSPTRRCAATRPPCEKLIAQKADVNAPQNDGATALHWAVYRGDKELVGMLVRAGANPKAANRAGSTPLWLASINGDAAIIAGLLEAGADANEKLPLGRTPLMIAARTGNVDAIKTLLDNGADVNAKETQRGTTALMWAADEAHAAAVKLLIERGADIKATVESGSAWTRAGTRQGQRSAQGRGGTGRSPRRRQSGLADSPGHGEPGNNAGRGGRNGGRGANAGAGGRGGAGNADRCGRRRPAGRRGGSGRIRSRETGAQRWRRADAARLRRARQRHRVGQGAARRRRRHQSDDGLWLESAARRDAEPLLQARRAICSSAAPIPTSPTRAAGCRCISPPTIATSRTATIPCARATWTIWSSSSSCWTRAPTSTRE